ncbi:MAG: hypothetical protein HY868_25010 [Chloroflexi bacterium]|nr:hypothetical protein [Chloroflexota bacterium]
MTYVRQLNELRLADHNWAGDKAARLGELIAAGFEVPTGFCVGADAYRDVVALPLNAQIVARLAQIEIEDPVELETATDEIRAWIENAPLPEALAREVAGAMANAPVAVRASRVIEDVPNPAASGVPQAYLGIVGIQNVLDRLRAIWSAPWNSRAIYFRYHKHIAPQQVTMAAVVQPVLNPDAAGVMFTANPLTGATDEIHIDATLGLGAAIIAARWKPDHFVVQRDGAITRRDIVTQVVMESPAPEGGIQAHAVPNEKQNAPSLSDAQVNALAILGHKIETHFHAPQDIEWCCVGDRIIILQARPLKSKQVNR